MRKGGVRKRLQLGFKYRRGGGMSVGGVWW